LLYSGLAIAASDVPLIRTNFLSGAQKL